MIPQMIMIPQKTRLLFALFLALFITHGTLANASQVEVSGRAYSATRCGYFPSSPFCLILILSHRYASFRLA
ncbi:MAG: hypothetical protein IPK04_21560 [Bdellovibrionales bacterium]|nr:hypothetical protein [Bdellovibrionales bacterium]